MRRPALLLPPLLLLAPAWAQEHVDLSVVDRIKSEAIDRSKAMDTPYQITELRGPALTALHDLSAAPTPASKTGAKNLNDVAWAESPEDLGKVFASLPNDLVEQLYDLSGSITAERGAFFAKEGAGGVLLEDTRAHEGMLFA